MNNAEYQAIYKFLATGILPTNFSSTKSNFKKKARKFNIKHKKLYKGDLAVIKNSEQQKVFSSTPGFSTSYNILGIVLLGPWEIRRIHDHRGRDTFVVR